jgi:uncharacterized protein
MAEKETQTIRPFDSAPEKGFDYDIARRWIGKASIFREGHDEVTTTDIRHWCEVMQDANPLYTDEEYAKTTKYGGIIAPPTMVQTWSLEPMQGALDQFVREVLPFPEDPHHQLFGAIDREGYDGVVATSQSQEYLQPVRPGDMISTQISVGSVSEYDHYTRMGVGRYVNLVFTFQNQRGETVCRSTFKVLKYRAPIATRRLYQG